MTSLSGRTAMAAKVAYLRHTDKEALPPSPDQQGSSEQQGNLFHQAAIYSNPSLLVEILKGSQRRCINFRDKHGRTALHAACLGDASESEGSVECLSLLLEAGADPNIAALRASQNRTPLHIAAKKGKLSSVMRLVEYGADLDVQDISSRTPLQLAEENQDLKMMEYFVNKTEERAILRLEKERELLTACSDIENLVILLQELGFSAINCDYKETLLYRATSLQNEDVVDFLISRGAKGKANRDTKETPLHLACYRGYSGIAEKLLEHFPWMSGELTNDNELPLHSAAKQGHCNLVRLLLTYPYESTTHDKETSPGSPHRLGSKSSPSFKSYKGDLPFYINQGNINGQTALYLACAAGHTDVVEELLDYQPQTKSSTTQQSPSNLTRVDIDTYTVEGKTPLHCAVISGYTEIVALLLKHGANVGLPIKSIHQLMEPTMGTISRKGNKCDTFKEQMHINTTDMSILYAAFQKQDCKLEIIKLLLSYGAKDVNGTVLLSANLTRNKEVVSLLLAYTGVHRDQDSTINELCRDKFKHLLLPMVSAKTGKLKVSPSGTLGKSLKRQKSFSDENRSSVLRRRRTLASIKRPTVTHSTFDTPVTVNWHDQNLTEVAKEWLIEASLRFNPALKHLDNIGNCIHDKVATITRLDISDNCLTKLPLLIFQLPSLQMLNISNNKLVHLPVGSTELVEETEGDDAPIVGWKLPCLKEMKLDGNRITQVPLDVFKLPALEALSLGDNLIEELPYDMWRAPSLRILNVSKNKLKELPTTVADSDEVFQTEVDSSSEDTVRMDYSLTNGEGDSGSENDNSYLAMDQQEHYVEMHYDAGISKRDQDDVKTQSGQVSLANLRRHQLCSAGSMVSVPIEESPSGEDICHLKELDLSHNEFQEVPPGLACLAPQLVKLVLSNNSVKNCGPINRLPAGLVDLYMSHNEVTCITTSARKHSLNKSTNKFLLFRGVYQSDDSCSTGLDFCYSPFMMQSATTSTASKHVSQDSTAFLPSSPKLTSPGKNFHCPHQRHRVLANLVTLDLSCNKLTSLNIATTILSCDSKEEEKYSTETDAGGVESQMHGIRQSSEVLSPSGSDIYLLFPSLKVLALSNNNLTAIPANIQHLTKLNSLKVDGNDQIREFPPEMGRLKNLLQLEFDGCPVRDDFSRDMKVSDILSFLDSILEDAKPYNRMKLMLVGKSDIGKTTLLHELRKETAVFGRHHSEILPSFAERTGSPNIGGKTLKGNYLSTVGVDVGEWTYCKKRGSKKVTFSTWDFGGQNEFYVTHQYFLTKRSIYLVIFKITDGRKCLSELQQWLVNIQARAPNSPVIIVGTHYDLLNQNKKYSREFWPDLKRLIEERFVVDSPQDMGLPNVQCCIEISCAAAGKYHNISYLREKIYDIAFSMKETKRGKDRETLLDKKIPTSYIALERAIRVIVANMKKERREPVMHTTEYKTEVARVMVEESEVSFHNKEELMLATKFLHNNGVLLYYEDALLSDYFFLDPQWLCDTLAKIVTIPEINPEAKKGVMLIKDLEQKFVNSNVNAFIRGLLNKFEVAVEYDNKHLLIPSLLPKQSGAINIPMIRRQEESEDDIETDDDEGGIRISSVSGSASVIVRGNTSPQSGSTVWSRKAVRKSGSVSITTLQSEKDRFPPPLRPLEKLSSPENRYSSPAAMAMSDNVNSISNSRKNLLTSVLSEKKSSSNLDVNVSSEWTKINPLDISVISNKVEDGKNSKSALDSFNITTLKLRKPPLRRLYVFQYIPSGFWSHIMCRFLSNEQLTQVTRAMFFPKQEVQRFLGDDAVMALENQYQWHCWQTGMELKFFDTTIFHIKQVTDTITNSFTKERRPDMIYMVNLVKGTDFNPNEVSLMRSSQVEILIPNQAIQISRRESKLRKPRTVCMEKSSEHVSQLLSLIMDLIEMLLDNFYPTLCEPLGTTYNGELFITRVVPCYKCWKEYNKTLCDDVNDDEWVFINNSDSDCQYFIEEDSVLLMGSFHRKKQKGICCPIPCVSPKHKRYVDFGIQNGMPCPSRPLPISRTKGGKHLLDDTSCSSMPLISQALEATDVDIYPLAKSLDENEEASFEESFFDDHFSASEEITSASTVKVCGFLLEELIYEGMRSQTTQCPTHGELPLSTLAPDVVFHDLGPELLIDDAQLEKKRLLGRGSFGLVFEGKICGDDCTKTPVALKMLQPYPPGEGARRTDRNRYEMENSKWQRFPVRFACEAYRTIRKELSIMLKLNHSSIVPLAGICHHPLCLILELAPMGALDNCLADYKRGSARLTATTVSSIVNQISSAVAYLHDNKIIYRDLKADNVLVWKFPEPHSSEHEPNELKVKLADYGISTTALPTGTKGFGGTPGYMAPEIVKYDGKETYTEKVDCFSFGMFMYELLSLQRPFDSAIGQGVGRLAQIIKHYIIEGQRPTLSHKEKAYPTYILDLMLWCWSQDPRDRPKMSHVKEVSQMPEFTTLMDVFSLDEDASVKDACVLELSVEGASTSVLCMTESIGDTSSKLSLLPLERSLGDDTTSLQVTIADSVVQCICAVGDMLWLALSTGYIKVFNGESCHEVVQYYCHQSHSKAHNITHMCHIPQLQLVAITADNQLILQKESDGLPAEEAGSFQYAELIGEITALAIINRNKGSYQVWCGHEEGKVTILEAANLAQPAEILSHFHDSNLVAWVQHLVTDTKPAASSQVWSSVYPDAIVYQWDPRTRKIESQVDIVEILERQTSANSSKVMKAFRRSSSGLASCQVSCMCLQNEILYVGIKGGQLILINTTSKNALHVINCHQGPVQFILGFSRDAFLNSRPLVSPDHMGNTANRNAANSGLITVGKRFADIFSGFGNAPTRLQGSEWDARFLLLWNTQPWELHRTLEPRESDC